MFRGRHDHAIDAKGRLSIPAGFRMELLQSDAEGTPLPPILTTEKNFLVLYPHSQWEKFESKLVESDPLQLQPKAQALTRWFIANSVESPLDAQGRIVIPKHLRSHANLERDVTLAGMGSRVEIWNTAAFEQAQSVACDTLDDLRTAFSSGGGLGS